MQNKLYVGNLSWNTDNAGLEKAFSTYGEIEEAKVIIDHFSGRSKGFGFLTFARQQDAEAALAMDGAELDGQAIKVNMSKEKPTKGRGSNRR